jgi:hypothetical protein
MERSKVRLRRDDLLKRLAALYIEAEPYLGHYAWHWETERWHEMIVCALVSSGCTPELARESVQVMKHMQLDTPETLVALSEENTTLVKYVFTRSGMSVEQSEQSIQAIGMAAAVCAKRWKGKPQIFLRKMTQMAANELAGDLRSEGMNQELANNLAVLWLQNVVSAPLLADSSPVIKAFCLSEGATHRELIDAMDHVGLNAAVLDEVLTLHKAADGVKSAATGGGPENNEQVRTQKTKSKAKKR